MVILVNVVILKKSGKSVETVETEGTVETEETVQLYTIIYTIIYIAI